MATWGELVRDANWFMIYYIALVHAGALVGLYCLQSCQWSTIAAVLVWYYLSGMGITAGCHRLWAHRSYKAHGSVRFFLMLCASLANQGTIFHWCRDHRVHHKHSDTTADPHNSGRGFFFSHMGWLLVKKDPRVAEAGKTLSYDDLWSDWTVVLQQKFNPWGQLFMCFAFPMLVTSYLNGDSWFNTLFICGFLRYVVVLHATWLVNSAAHFYGFRPYDESIPPRENYLVSIAAAGEGWHNWHHKFPYDYATSEFGVTQQWNPTKLTIDILAFLGLVYDRKRAVPIWEKMKANKMAKHAGQEVPEENATQAFSELKAKAM